MGIIKGEAINCGDAQKSFREMTETVTSVLGVDRASVWLFSEDRSYLENVDLYEFAEARHSTIGNIYKVDLPNYFKALETDRVIDSNNASHDQRTHELAETYLIPLGIASMLDAPIRIGGQTVGVICLEQAGTQRCWNTEEIYFAGSLADLAAHAIESQKRKQVETALLESEERYRRTASLTKTGHLTWDEVENKAVYCSEELANMYGVSVEEYLTRSSTLESDLLWFHPDDRERYAATIKNALENRTGYNISARIIRDDGEIRYLEEFTDVKLAEDGTVLQTIGAIQDHTERKLIEEELRTQSQILTNMVEGSLLIRADDDIIVYTNPSFDKMFGYESGELSGQPSSILNAALELSAEEVSRDISGRLENEGAWHGEVANVRKDGSVFWSSVNASTFNHSIHGKVWVSVQSDITESRAAKEELHYHAIHDSLTGLINRHEFEHHANQIIAMVREDKHEHAMCFIDLDQFKVINDTCGHAAGDELLRQLGFLLRNTVRKGDTLARLGGDEFGVLMEHCSLESAQRQANSLLDALKEFRFNWGEDVFRVGASIGLVAITESTGNFTELFKQADAACYLAKDLGRNRIQVYRPDDIELANLYGEMQWVGRINKALEEDRLCLYAQPIVSLQNDSLKHYELLIRLLEKDGTMIPPGSFLPAAERYNLIGKIDAWVVEKACSLLAQYPDFVAQTDFISINLSGPSLTDKRFLQTILDNLAASGIAPGKICFEITETVAISNLDSANHLIATLKDKQCRFALDDFGSGISSFGYLKNLPVDFLKIDGMFVKDIADDAIDYAMVKSINEIGHVMGMKTIAEFVENDQVRDILADIGVDYGQGFGLGKPQPFTQILEKYNKKV